MIKRWAAAITLGVVAAACATTGPTVTPTPSDDGTPTATSSPTPSDTPTSPDDAFPAPGPARDLGEGRVLAAGNDGRSLLVLADDPDDGERLACEGAPFEYLWRLDVDAPEQRTLALVEVTAADQPYIGNVLVSPDGQRLLLIGACEGFLGDILVAELGPDATVRDLREVSYPAGEWASHTIRWTPDSDAFTITASTVFDAAGAIMVFPDTGEWVDLSDDRLVDFLLAPGDRAVEVTEEAAVRWLAPDGTVIAQVPGDVAAVSPDGSVLLVTDYGEPGVVTLVDLDGTTRRIADVAAFAPTFTPDAAVVGWLHSTGEASALTLHDLTSGRQHEVTDVGYGAPVFLPGAIAYTGLVEGDDGYWIPVLRLREWDR